MIRIFQSYDRVNEGDYEPKGNHGYGMLRSSFYNAAPLMKAVDNEDPEMQAIFLATGPIADQLVTASKAGRGEWASTDPPVLKRAVDLPICIQDETILTAPQVSAISRFSRL